MKKIKSELTSGLLHEYCEKTAHTLIYGTDVVSHAGTYEGNHGSDMYAEPEFTGKYIDICTQLYRRYQDLQALKNAQTVVESIIKNQRSSGYTGCLPEGKEFINFGVWNQAFTILGLLSYYRETKDKTALEAAEKSAVFTMEYYISGKADILDSLNDGTQHISILISLCSLYEITKKDTIRKYIEYIVKRMKNSSLNYFEFDSILTLRSRKGIESFVILLGIIKYSELFGDTAALESVKKYWQQVNDTQIRNTGNGTIGEFWTENGNGCQFLGADKKPNETCVAVGWIELSASLFMREQNVKYLNAIDKTLYNHILASVSDDGDDFAYYQPNYGKRVKATEKNLYKCCRYRGFTLFSYMNEMLYFENESTIIPLIYTSGQYCSDDTVIEMKTDYPFNPVIKLTVSTRKSKNLLLRVPERCSVKQLTINGIDSDFTISDGYISLCLNKNSSTDVSLVLKNKLYTEYGTTDGENYVSFSYGCILLVKTDNDRSVAIKKGEKLTECKTKSSDELLFRCTGLKDGKEVNVEFCRYSDADDFTVWVKLHNDC